MNSTKSSKKRDILLKKIKTRVTQSLRREDNIIIEEVSTVETIDKVLNLLYERLEDWTKIYYPEIRYKSMEQLVNKVSKETDKPLPVKSILDLVSSLYEHRKQLVEDIRKRTRTLCPNMSYLIGEELTAKLLSAAGSLERLADAPASTVQVLGAEKAFFKHLRKGTKPPKHGLLFQYPAVNRAPKRLRGKIARAIATKLAIAAKADALTKNFIADKLKEKMDRQIDRILKNVRR